MVIPTHGMRLGTGRRATRRAIEPGAVPPFGVTVALDEPAAQAVSVVGAKTANLAIAAAARLPVLPGFGVPVAIVAEAVAAGGFPQLAAGKLDELHAAWRRVSADGAHPVVARSSAVSEDAAGSSMAGRFHSELDISGWRNFLDALDRVADSASVVALDGSQTVELHDMAILVQRFLPAVYGGVLFGAEPVTGRTDRFALATVQGGPDALVSGVDGGSQQTLTRHGRAVKTEGDASVAPSRRRRRQLAALARRTANVFGVPQDVEWGVDRDGNLWLLQSRPVTTLGTGAATGPLLGPGPVAETFPDPLSALEQDLWLVPLREGMVHAIDLTGAVPRRALADSPVAVAIGGRAAVDLRLINAIAEHESFVHKLDPRPGARRLRAAWRIGRLRRALPALAHDLLATVDRDLRAVPPLSTAEDEELLTVLHGARRALLALHGQEVLAGLLVKGTAPTDATGASIGLAALATARDAGVPDAQITALHPEVLALVPPAIRPMTLPPPTVAFAPPAPQPLRRRAPDPMLETREGLRMRARWVQELSALAAWELGERLEARGLLEDRWQVRRLDLKSLEAALVGHRPTLPPLPELAPPLPAVFRLDGAGRPVAVETGIDRAGQGAGGGRRAGRVVHDVSELAELSDNDRGGNVLVTTTLDPSLAAMLPALSGLISETGSVLSHLAILARELGVPTVVGVSDARTRFPAGVQVVVDGATGAIEVETEIAPDPEPIP